MMPRNAIGFSKMATGVRQFLADESGTAVLAIPRLLAQRSAGFAAVTASRPQYHWPAPAAHPVKVRQFVAAAGNRSREYRFVKRGLDIVGALALLVILSPLLLGVLAVLAVTTRGKPLFSQERVGLCGRRFRMYKFRTMRLDADKLQHLVQNEKDGPIFKNKRDPRVTKLGRWLRKTSIDEMPQLVSVLVGHMSLVGPRPPVPKEVAKYKGWQRRRLSVKPGLTCLWQVSGRSEIGFDDWVRLDIWYVQHQSVWTDFKLLARTPLSVITCKGAY